MDLTHVMYDGVEPPLDVHFYLAPQGKPVPTMIMVVAEHRLHRAQTLLVDRLAFALIAKGMTAYFGLFSTVC